MRRRGFTLIEVMIVIAIIAILLSILIPHCRGKGSKTPQQVEQPVPPSEG